MAHNATGCPKPMKATSNGAFHKENPLDYALPLAILQICLVLVLTRTLAFFLRPLRQPRVIAEIVGGILLGPSALGKYKPFIESVFPPRSITVLDTLANLGLLFFLFLVGLELDPKSLKKTGKEALSIALAGISLPFIMGIGTSVVLRATISKGVNGGPFLVFMGVSLSITAFPVLARILAELKLLTTDVGRMAMSAAAVNDVAAWILLALAVALSGTEASPLIPILVLISGIGFVTFCVFCITPVFRWVSQRCPSGEPVDEIYICGTLAAVLAAGFVTDTIGIHALFGAFVLGILVPKEGPLAGALVEKVEDLVTGLLLPLYFVSSGLKTDLFTIQGGKSWGLLLLVIVTACVGKVVGTLAVALLFKMPFREALALGILMNTKGLVELIVLNIGKDRKVLNDETFAILVLMALVTTFITTPLVMSIYTPAKQGAIQHRYKHRAIQRVNPRTQLRILACFHCARDIPTMINLIEATRGTEKRRSLCVYAMHLMELSERPSAIRMVHKARKNGLPFWNKGIMTESNQIEVAFEAYQQLCNVIIRPMTAISHMSEIYKDICNSAEDKRACLIILPFHKHTRFDGTLEITRHDYRTVNKKVLEKAKCSVGILVDRGLGGSSQVAASNVSSIITVLFFGGPDDREALAYGQRMAEHPGITLVIVHIYAAPEFNIGETQQQQLAAMDVSSSSRKGRDHIDDDSSVIQEVKNRAMKDPSVKYEERPVMSWPDTVEVVKGVAKCNMFLVGMCPTAGPLTASMKVRGDCPELGPSASLLISGEVTISASVLVFQQYRRESMEGESASASSSSGQAAGEGEGEGEGEEVSVTDGEETD